MLRGLSAVRLALCPYTALGLPMGADKTRIKERYRELALVHHPDRGGSERHFIRYKQAYESLVSGTPFGHEEEEAAAAAAASAANAQAASSTRARSGYKEEQSTMDMYSLPETMFLYRNMVVNRASATEEQRKLRVVKAGMVLYALPGAGPKFAGFVVVVGEASERGGVIAYCVNKRGARRGHEDVDGAADRWVGGPNGHRGHQCMMHWRDAVAQREEFTTRSAAGAHFDAGITDAKAATYFAKTKQQQHPHRMLRGYCAWSPGVLDRVVRRGAWKAVDTSADPTCGFLRDTPYEELYDKVAGMPTVSFD